MASDPDLLHAKLQLEERVKYALRYEFDLESPLPSVQRFFECAFSPEQNTHGPIKEWKALAEEFILNTTFLPLSHQFHSVYLAAAYLNWTKQYLTKQAEKPWSVLPDLIAGHAWFAYVDPAISHA